MPDFDHRDPGTPESVWTAELARRDIRPIDLEVDDLVVVAAHPDDESLGAAGLIQRASSLGIRVTVVIASDGESSHPLSVAHRPADLAARRRDEVRLAIDLLHADARLHFLSLPDGGLRESRAELRHALGDVVDGLGASRVLLAAPWSGDGHRDHRIAAEVVADIAGERQLRHVGYPIWLWHWGGPEDAPWSDTAALRLTPAESEMKRRAIAAHVSQLEPLSADAGDEVILHERMRSHFDRDVEVYVEETRPSPSSSLDAAWFDAFYDRNGADPWGFETRWYEERKRGIILAALPTERLGAVLELGCAGGMLTRELAARADRVVAVDAATSAVETARDRVFPDDRVEVIQAVVPGTWPAGTFDTIVLSEMGYYLSPADLAATIERMAGSLAPGGVVVACHWRHPVAEYPLTGDEVHEALRRRDGWRRLVVHREADFVLEVFGAEGARSVAEREGLA